MFGVKFFSWTYYYWKCNISIQNVPVKSRCLEKLNRPDKIDISQRTEFFHWLLYFFKIWFEYKNSRFNAPITKISIFLLHVSIWVLFESVFSLPIYLNYLKRSSCLKWKTVSQEELSPCQLLSLIYLQE